MRTKRPCAISECSKLGTRSYCPMHNARYERHGDPLYEPPTPIERFMTKVKAARSGCLEWTGGVRNDKGYGEFWFRGRMRLAHRVAYELAVGPIPAGLEVRHACDNPRCVSPVHLSLGTHAENMADMSRRGRSLKGLPRGSRPTLNPSK